MNYKIAIVGSQSEILGFKGLGLEIHAAESQKQVEEKLFDLKKKTVSEDSTEKYAIVFVIETFIEAMEKEKYQKLSHGALPAFIPVPGHQGASGFGEKKIRRIVEQAVGSDIFANN